MDDIYDAAVAFLEENPHRIIDVWDDPQSHPSGILFLAASPSGLPQQNLSGDGTCGDVCEILSKEAVAYSTEVTDMILTDNDRPLPKVDGESGLPEIEPAMLDSFAQWQRTFDLEWDRSPVRKLHEWGFEPQDLGVTAQP
tara:strand:+ start:110581 stop:111000 length:420 start_codon:yes stop_codon:yes gene_type:complete